VNRPPAAIHDEIARGEEGFDFIEADHANHTRSDETRRRRGQGASSPTDFGEQGRDAGGDGGSVSAVERGCGVRDSDATKREFGARKFGPSHKRRGKGGGGPINRRQRVLRSLELADEELAARADQPGVKGIGVVAECVERLHGGIEPGHPPGQIASGEGNLGLGYLATSLGEAFATAKGAGGALQELARSLVVAELGHGNAAQGERRRVVAQRNAFERTERITGRQQSCGGSDEGVHGGRMGNRYGASIP
jgi:hypothetical protein